MTVEPLQFIDEHEGASESAERIERSSRCGAQFAYGIADRRIQTHQRRRVIRQDYIEAADDGIRADVEVSTDLHVRAELPNESIALDLSDCIRDGLDLHGEPLKDVALLEPGARDQSVEQIAVLLEVASPLLGS